MEVNGVVLYEAAPVLVVQRTVCRGTRVDVTVSADGGDVKEGRRTTREIENKMQGASLSAAPRWSFKASSSAGQGKPATTGSVSAGPAPRYVQVKLL